MGYFANGTAAMVYSEMWCVRCIHWSEDSGCPCWSAHWMWNYDECNKPDSILHRMIPRTDDGATNGECFAFKENTNG